MQNIIQRIDELNVFDKNIEKVISKWVEKLVFSIFWSDYKTFNQNIDKTISFLNKWYTGEDLDKLKNESSLSSIILFVWISDNFQNNYWKWFEEIYRYLVKNNIELVDDSKLNRLFFKALSRLSFIDVNWNYIFPNLSYNENYLKSLNGKIDDIVHDIKSEWLKANPSQWIKSNILAWITNIWIEKDNLKTFLSLFWEEQDNMYEQKMWFLIWYLISKKHPLEVIIEEWFNNKIKSLKNDFKDIDYSNNLIKEPEPTYNVNPLSSKPQKMINNLTSQESLLLLSLLTKPFSILYWVSWTWKSRVVKELWKKIYWEGKYKEYFTKEAVPPNWFDETEILWRYNEIEKYKEGSFTKVLEKAIKDTENNYVYLLDEMNLSHIEQYFAQYLSAVEDLDNGNAWINIWDTSSYSLKKYLENTKDTEIKVDIQNPINLVKKYSFISWTLKIDWKEITSNKSFSDFQIEIFKYIVDDYLTDEANIDEIVEKFWFDTVESIKSKWYTLLWEEKIPDLWEKWFTIYLKKDNWKNTHNSYFYKGFIIDTMHNYDTRLIEIKKLVSTISEDFLNNLDIIFTPYDKTKKSIINTDNNENIIYYYKDNELVWKSLKIPKNLFVVGTINLDETTKSISPKVVDRANLIEFNDIDNYTFLKDNWWYDLKFLESIKFNENFKDLLDLRLTKEKWDTNSSKWKINKDNEELMQKLYDYLKKFKLHFSYRTINEILTFVALWKKLLWKDKENKLLDLVIMQKVLPKLNWVIDPSFKLSHEKAEKYLYYNLDDSDDTVLSNQSEDIKKLLKDWIFEKDNDFINTSIKLQRMQQFFDTYQNVNYFLS